MNFIVRYLSHPQVNIRPDVPIEQWSLNDEGKSRTAAIAAAPALRETTRVISSAEVKALETATPLADALGIQPEIRPLMHENDRSATGYLPKAEFEATADLFFSHPDQSIRGWETARAAQARIVSEVDALLEGHTAGDILVTGHGGVGTLLYCALCGIAIDRRHDQSPGGGCFFAFSMTDRTPLFGWRPMEALLA